MTISPDYLRQQQDLHANPNYGVASQIHAPIVAGILKRYNLTSLSDYGAGKRRLYSGLSQLGVQLDHYFPYDPVFPDYGPPRSAELLCCIDVLEHIEIDYLDAVLDELQSLVTHYCYLTVHTGPAIKVLNDGRNAHLIQAPASWWLARLVSRFEVLHLQSMDMGFWVFGAPQQQKALINARN